MTDTPADPPLYYTRHVFCCLNRRADGHPRGSCAARDSEKLRNYMKARAKEIGLDKVRINGAACLERCELGPAIVIYPEGVWYRCATIEDAELILQRHIVEGGRVPELMLTPEMGP
ncbi:MAG: NAD(P)H-dependent oxidoreductase subunit E [Thalassobaculales bacterium]